MVQTFLIAAALLGSAIACPDHRGLWKRASEEADYDYQYPQGWGRLQEEYSPCFVGSQQAPLNLATNDGSCKHHTPTFNYSMQMHGNLENSGTSLSYTLSDTDDTTKLPSFIFQEKAHLDEEVYLIGWYVLARPRNIGAWCFNLITTKVLADKLYARHLHSPSEHTRDGSAAKAEMHFVHADAEGNARSVLGFLIQPSPGNGTQSKFFNHISQPYPSLNSTDHEDMMLDPSLALEDVGGFEEFWSYQGSLTTPPCTEGIRWFVASQPLYVDNDTLESILAVSRYSARPTQQRWMHAVNE